MQLTYCERWNPALGRPVDRLGREQARERDRAGTGWYTVVVGPLVRPDCYLEVAWPDGHLGVWFLDEYGRVWLHYGFTRHDERRLFLDAVVRWEYPPGPYHLLGDADRIEEISYRPDGTVRHEILDVASRRVTETDYADVPLDINFEPVPAFGDYRSVTRLDRAPAAGWQLGHQ